MKQAWLHNSGMVNILFCKKNYSWNDLQDFRAMHTRWHVVACFQFFLTKYSSKLLLQSLYWLVFKRCFLPVFMQCFRKVMFVVSLLGPLPLVAKLICENDDESNLYQLHYFGFKWKSQYEHEIVCRKLDLCDKCEISNVNRDGYEHRFCWLVGVGKGWSRFVFPVRALGV